MKDYELRIPFTAQPRVCAGSSERCVLFITEAPLPDGLVAGYRAAMQQCILALIATLRAEARERDNSKPSEQDDTEVASLDAASCFSTSLCPSLLLPSHFASSLGPGLLQML